jgi:hypothetical protein
MEFMEALFTEVILSRNNRQHTPIERERKRQSTATRSDLIAGQRTTLVLNRSGASGEGRSEVAH